MDKKNICFFTSSLNDGGAEKVLIDLANSFSQSYNVTILTLEDSILFFKVNKNVQVHSLKLSISRPQQDVGVVYQND